MPFNTTTDGGSTVKHPKGINVWDGQTDPTYKTNPPVALTAKYYSSNFAIKSVQISQQVSEVR